MRLRIALFAATLLAGPAWASDVPVYQPAPGWVAPAPAIDATKPADGSMLLMLDQQQLLADGMLWAYAETAMRVVSAEALGQLGTMTLPWHPAKGDLIIHRVQILRGGETIDLLAKGARFTVLQREQQLERQTLTGILSATMPIEGLRVGDIVRMAFSVTEKDAALAGRVQAIVPLLADPARVQFARTRFIWPAADKLSYRAYGTMPPVKPVRAGPYQDITVTLPLPKQPEMPGDAPARFARPPILEASSFANWQDVSRTAAPLYRTEGLIPPGSPLAAEVARIAATESHPRRRAAAALQLVQDQVRYLFRGMDQGNYVPQTPAQTWNLRYGDCKAKTLLLLAILHALDVKAEPVLTNLSLGDWLPERLPGFSAFDHVLVRAEIAGKSLWLDGTGSGSRLEDLDDALPIGMVLPVRAEGAALMAVPMHAKARPDVMTDVEFDQSAGISFPPSFKLTMTVRGQMAEMLRLASAREGEQGVKEAVNGVVGGYVNDGVAVTRKVSFDDIAGTATIEATGIANLSWRKEDDRYQTVLDKAVRGISFEPDRSRPAWQAIPVAVAQFPSQRIRTRLRLPTDGKGFELQGDIELSETMAGIDVFRRSSLDKDWVTVEEQLSPSATELPASAIPATRARIAQAQTRLFKVVAPANYPARWQQVQTARAAGLFAPALALYGKGIEDEPEEVASYRNRALFLAGVYDHRGAIADVDQIIKRAPDASIYVWRARLHAQLGDKKKALADLEAARKLDPGLADVTRAYALLLGDLGRGEEGLKLIDDGIAVGGNERSGYMAAKAELLAQLGRVDEGVKIMDAAVVASPGSTALLNSRCWLKGTRNVMLDTALKDCTKAIELAESPAAMLDSRAMVYFRMGRLEDARADLDAALAISPDIAAALFMRGVVRGRTGDTSGAVVDLGAARLMAPRIDDQYAQFGIKP